MSGPGEGKTDNIERLPGTRVRSSAGERDHTVVALSCIGIRSMRAFAIALSVVHNKGLLTRVDG